MFIVTTVFMLFVVKRLRDFVIENYFFISIFIILIILMNLDLQLIVGKEVYYSDATMYWELYIRRDFQNYSGNFIYYLYLCNFFGLFNSVGLVIACNVCLYIVIVFLVNIIVKNYYAVKNKKNIVFMNFILFTNGVIAFMVFRTLKDIVYNVLIVGLLFLFESLLNKRIKSLLFALISLPLFILLPSIRPWTIGLPFIFVVMYLLHKIPEKYVLPGCAVVLTSFTLFYNALGFQHYIDILVKMNESFSSETYIGSDNSVLGFAKKILTFLLGPGLYRIIDYKKSFDFTTGMGNVGLFFGIIEWYLVLSIIFYTLMVYRHNIVAILTLSIKNTLFVISMVFMMIYVMSYNGSVESRLRADFYITFTPFLAVLVEKYGLKINHLSLVAVWIGLLFSTLLFIR